MTPEENAKIIQIIQNTIKGQGYTVNEALTNSKAGKDLISNMRKGQTPSIEKFTLLADFLNVSIDCLLGRENQLLKIKEMNSMVELNRKGKTILYDALLSLSNTYEVWDIRDKVLADLPGMSAISDDELKEMCATINKVAGISIINIDHLFAWLNIYGQSSSINYNGIIKSKSSEFNVKEA